MAGDENGGNNSSNNYVKTENDSSGNPEDEDYCKKVLRSLSTYKIPHCLTDLETFTKKMNGVQFTFIDKNDELVLVLVH